MNAILDARLHIVTGKGGTGKTTVAAALALALAGHGRRVLLCEVEGRQGIASVFDVAPLPYEERRIAIGSDGGEIWALAIDAEAALLEYLSMFYRLGRAGRALDRFGVIDFATTIAPGVRDVLLVGKVYEASRRPAAGRPGDRSGRRGYDAIVLDAPPTGRIGRFLNVNAEVVGIAKVGPIKKQAESIMRLLVSPTTRVHVVTTLEEMPVQEALDGVAEVRAIGLHPGSLIVNMRRPRFSASSAGKRSVLARALGSAGIDASDDLLTALADAGRADDDRRDLEDEQLARLDAADVSTVTLPVLPDGVDLGGLYDLADLLHADEG